MSYADRILSLGMVLVELKLLPDIIENFNLTSDTSSHLREKYKDSDEFKRLVKCLEENCGEQYNRVLKYKQWIESESKSESSTDAAKAE